MEDKYKNITKEHIEEVFRDIFYNKSESDQKRVIKLITWEEGFKLFKKCMEEELSKILSNDRNNKSD